MPHFSFCPVGGTKMSRYHLLFPLRPSNTQNFLNIFFIDVAHSLVVSLIFHNQQYLGLMISLELLFFILISSFCTPLTWTWRSLACRGPQGIHLSLWACRKIAMECYCHLTEREQTAVGKRTHSREGFLEHF